jgi:hypothetical protein
MNLNNAGWLGFIEDSCWRTARLPSDHLNCAFEEGLTFLKVIIGFSP